MTDLHGKTALITGGSRGIGLAIARALGQRGARVSLCARGAEGLEEARRDLKADGITVLVTPTDVSDPAAVDHLVAATVQEFGGIDVLVNNAGFGIQNRPVEEIPPEKWESVLGTNLTGAFLVARAALPHLKRADWGYLFNVSSYAGKVGLPGIAAYNAAKFGLTGLSASLVRELKETNVRVTALCPGMVDTRLVAKMGIPAEEMIRPQDMAQTVLYLLDLSPQVVIREIVIERQGSI